MSVPAQASSSTLLGDEDDWDDLYTIDPEPELLDSSTPISFLDRLVSKRVTGQPLPTTPVRPRQPNPIESSSGPIRSDPIIGTKAQRTQIRLKKSAAKRSQILRERNQKRRDAEMQQRNRLIEAALAMLKQNSVRLKDLLDYIFDPANRQGTRRWQEYFVHGGMATQLLNWFSSSKYPKSVRMEVHKWALDYVGWSIANEARTVTRWGVLNSNRRPITAESVASFDLARWYEDLSTEMAPTAMAMISAFATSRHSSTHNERRKARTCTVVTSVALACLGEYSHANNLVKRKVTLYLYSTGAQRQTISVLSRMGVCGSYSNLISTKIRKSRPRKPAKLTEGGEANPAQTPPESHTIQYEGTLPQLSHSIRCQSREVAATGASGLILDNINMAFLVGEQAIGRNDSQENGTCATLFPLHNTTPEDLDIEHLREAFLSAQELEFSDIMFTPEEKALFQSCLIHTILQIIVRHGGPNFQRFANAVETKQPTTNEKIDLHKTELFPLPAMNIDQSSITGNASVDEAIVKELELDSQPNFLKHGRFIAGDQLTIARFRSLETIRAGHESGYEGYFWGIWVPGLFHTKIADAHGVLLTHFGKPNSGARNPGSLSFHNTVLDRHPVTINPNSTPPKFRIARDLIFTSLYARVLHCLLLVSDSPSLDAYTEKYTTYNELYQHAADILDQFASRDLVQDLRWKRKVTDDPNEGDMVFENANLFLADALVSREFTDAIKSGDSGRIFLVLKHMALSFRGNGRLKYAYEMLHTIHNLSKVFPESVRQSVKSNWVLNPSGKPNSWVEADLVQEHSNLKIKTNYKAHGSNASWDWLALIAPCTEVLRALANTVHSDFGHDQGTKHANANLDADIRALMDSLEEHAVYRLKPGRVLDEDDAPVPDVVSVGTEQLTSQTKSPLTEYNAAFRSLQERRRMQPVSEEPIPSSPQPSEALAPDVGSGDTTLPEPAPNVNSTEEEDLETFEELTYEEMERTFEPELVQIMREVRDGLDEAALPRVADDDVAYDMDDVTPDSEPDFSDSDSSNHSDDGSDNFQLYDTTDGEEEGWSEEETV